MKKYVLTYYYMAQGMDFEESFGPTIIKAKNKERAMWKFHRRNGFWKNSTYREFLKSPSWKREWGTTYKEVK